MKAEACTLLLRDAERTLAGVGRAGAGEGCASCRPLAGGRSLQRQRGHCGLSVCPLPFCTERFWALAPSPELGQLSAAGCVAGRPGNWVRPRRAARGVGACDTYVQTCPSADSLAVGRLLNPTALQFPHPKKCCRLSPGALFSFQGFCGVGRLGSRAEQGGPALPCLTLSRSGLPLVGQTQPLLSARAPGCGISRGAHTNFCDGRPPCPAVQQRLPEDCEPAAWERGLQLQRLPPSRKGRAGWRSGSGWVSFSLQRNGYRTEEFKAE